MKLDRLAFSRSLKLGTSLLALACSVALACGCSSSVAGSGLTRTASAAPLSAEASSLPGTTNLMFARLAGPAPKVGKAHLAVDDLASSVANDKDGDLESGSTGESDAPKEARRSDGSRRGGGFGSSK